MVYSLENIIGRYRKKGAITKYVTIRYFSTMDGAVDLAMHNTAFDIYQVTTPYLPLTLSSVKESRELQVIIIILLTRRLGIPPQIT